MLPWYLAQSTHSENFIIIHICVYWVTVKKKCENHWLLSCFGFFSIPAIKELWLIQKLILGVRCVKWQTPKYGGGWVAESGVRNSGGTWKGRHQKVAVLNRGGLQGQHSTGLRDTLSACCRQPRLWGQTTTQAPSSLKKLYSRLHTKFSVSKSKSALNPVGDSTKKKEEHNWGNWPLPLNISHYALSLPNRGRNFPFIKCHPQEYSPGTRTDCLPHKATRRPSQKNLRTPESWVNMRAKRWVELWDLLLRDRHCTGKVQIQETWPPCPLGLSGSVHCSYSIDPLPWYTGYVGHIHINYVAAGCWNASSQIRPTQ